MNDCIKGKKKKNSRCMAGISKNAILSDSTGCCGFYPSMSAPKPSPPSSRARVQLATRCIKRTCARSSDFFFFFSFFPAIYTGINLFSFFFFYLFIFFYFFPQGFFLFLLRWIISEFCNPCENVPSISFLFFF